MIDRAVMERPRSAASLWGRGAACVLLALAAPACGGPVMSGVAAGKAGNTLTVDARVVPQGAEVCALQNALASSGSGTDKPDSEVCAKALKSDQLWRRVMIVLGAYAETLGAVAAGTSGDSAGQLEAARTGVRGGTWIDADGAQEQAARDAAAQLVSQMGATDSKGDLGRLVKDAAPHVKALCEGLGATLDAETRSLADMQKEIEKKRASRTDRRCALLDGRTLCVSESVLDRMTYATVFGELAALEGRHQEARDAVAGFCAAHKKLEEAAADGRLSKDKTFQDVVEAVKSARAAPSSTGGKSAKK